MRKSVLLDGVWKATRNISTDLGFVRGDYDDSGWTDVPVPGHWQTVEEFSDYPGKLLYRKKFRSRKPAPGRRVFLRLNGVFYFCRVWCNGKYLGEHSGYFNPFEFDITDVVGEENQLAVFVRCEVEKDADAKTQVLGVFAHWDCKPAAAQPGGIWNSVELLEKGPLSVEAVQVGEFEISEGDATAVVKGVVQGPPRAEHGDLKIGWEISPDNFTGAGLHGEFLLDARDSYETAFAFEIYIPDAKLWWPRGHGGQRLYRLRLGLEGGGNVLDTAAARFGVRTLEMKEFILKVNGRRVFCRGSNYAPGDLRPAAAGRALYEKDAELMAGANLNMVRVHAHVERPEFYDACDEKGIMVFQDFPLQGLYSSAVEEEAVEQAAEMAVLLGNHPCIAVWCCHNEPFKAPGENSVLDAIMTNRLQDFLKDTAGLARGNWNKDTLDPKLEETLKVCGGGRPVIRHSGVPGLVRGGTDSHLYFGWYVGTMRMLKGLPGLHRRSMRFVTEYGAQAYPNPESFRRLQNVNSLKDVDWKKLQAEHMLQKKIMDKFAPVKKDGSLEDCIEVSQWYQARLIRYFNEFLRVHKYDPCGGAVHFLFNDCCPGVTWSVVDYWRSPKKGYEALRDSFRPLLAVAEFPKRWYPCGETVSSKLSVVNDRCEAVPGAQVRWAFFDAGGKCLAEGLKVVDIAEDSAAAAGRAKWDSADAPPGGYALVVELTPPGAAEPITSQYEFELRKRGRPRG